MQPQESNKGTNKETNKENATPPVATLGTNNSSLSQPISQEVKRDEDGDTIMGGLTDDPPAKKTEAAPAPVQEEKLSPKEISVLRKTLDELLKQHPKNDELLAANEFFNENPDVVKQLIDTAKGEIDKKKDQEAIAAREIFNSTPIVRNLKEFEAWIRSAFDLGKMYLEKYGHIYVIDEVRQTLLYQLGHDGGGISADLETILEEIHKIFNSRSLSEAKTDTLTNVTTKFDKLIESSLRNELETTSANNQPYSAALYALASAAKNIGEFYFKELKHSYVLREIKFKVSDLLNGEDAIEITDYENLDKLSKEIGAMLGEEPKEHAKEKQPTQRSNKRKKPSEPGTALASSANTATGFFESDKEAKEASKVENASDAWEKYLQAGDFVTVRTLLPRILLENATKPEMKNIVVGHIEEYLRKNPSHVSGYLAYISCLTFTNDHSRGSEFLTDLLKNAEANVSTINITKAIIHFAIFKLYYHDAIIPSHNLEDQIKKLQIAQDHLLKIESLSDVEFIYGEEPNVNKQLIANRISEYTFLRTSSTDSTSSSSNSVSEPLRPADSDTTTSVSSSTSSVSSSSSSSLSTPSSSLNSVASQKGDQESKITDVADWEAHIKIGDIITAERIFSKLRQESKNKTEITGSFLKAIEGYLINNPCHVNGLNIYVNLILTNNNHAKGIEFLKDMIAKMLADTNIPNIAKASIYYSIYRIYLTQSPLVKQLSPELANEHLLNAQNNLLKSQELGGVKLVYGVDIESFLETLNASIERIFDQMPVSTAVPGRLEM